MSDRDRVRSAHGRVEESWKTTDFDDFVGYDYQSESPSHGGRLDLRVEGMATFLLCGFLSTDKIAQKLSLLSKIFLFLAQHSKLMLQKLLGNFRQ